MHPAYLADGGVEQDPGELLDSVLAAGRQAVAAAGCRSTPSPSRTRARRSSPGTRDTGDPLSRRSCGRTGARSRCAPSCASTRSARRAHRAGARPLLLAPRRWRGCGATSRATASCTTTDAWLLHHLTGEFVTDVTTASRSLVLDLDAVDWDAGAARASSASPTSGCRASSPATRSSGTTTAFGGDVPVGGLIVDQQAALLAEGCRRPGQRQVHVRHGRLPAGEPGTTATRLEPRADDLRGLAARDPARPTASTGRSTPPRRRCGGSSSSGLLDDPRGLDAACAAGQRGRAVRAGPRRARRAVVAARRARLVARA